MAKTCFWVCIETELGETGEGDEITTTRVLDRKDIVDILHHVSKSDIHDFADDLDITVDFGRMFQ